MHSSSTGDVVDDVHKVRDPSAQGIIISYLVEGLSGIAHVYFQARLAWGNEIGGPVPWAVFEVFGFVRQVVLSPKQGTAGCSDAN